MRYSLIFLFFGFSSCLSFKGITIPDEVKTYYVEPVEVRELNAPAEVAQIFLETLRQKVREQSRLLYDDQEPHVIFTPIITKYSINSVAPQEGDLVAFNRLDIGVSISYEDTTNEENDYTKSFNAFEDYPASENLQDREEELISTIFDDITERIFNDTFSDW